MRCTGLLLLVASLLPSVLGVTCDKSATGSGGFGIVDACGSSVLHVGDALQESTILTSSNGVLELTLSVEPWRFNTTAFSFTTRAFCYEGSCNVPGPTLRVFPGDTIRLTLVNKLSDEGYVSGVTNDLRKPNVTNIHTHGLHVDPHDDNIFIQVYPGNNHTYELTIPENHMPGLHWYHSHLHGASALQVMGGLVGAVEVHWKHAAEVPAVLNDLPSKVLVLTHHSMCSCNPTKDPFRIISYLDMASEAGDLLPADVQVGSLNLTDVYLVNGQFQPVLELQPGAWTRLDIVNAVGDTYAELEIRTEIGGGTNACEIRALGYDGVLLDSPRTIATFVPFAPASRANIAVRCNTAGTYFMQLYPGNRICDAEAQFRQNLITISVSVSGATVSSDDLSWSSSDVIRPWYMQDMRTHSDIEGEWQMGIEQTAVVGGATWLGVGRNCTLPCSGRSDCETFCAADASLCEKSSPNPSLIGECAYLAWGGASMEIRHVAKLCSVEDGIIQGRGKTPHPIHIHVNHFQIIEAPNAFKNYWGEIGDWRDTVPAIAGSTRIRYALDTYGGVIVQHCHFLYHEDRGMMDRFWADDADFCLVSGGGSTGANISYCSPQSGAYSSTPPQVMKQCPGTNSVQFNGTEIVLGRITASSVVANLLFTTDIQAFIEYGETSGSYDSATTPTSITANVAKEIPITGLQENTRYYYRLRMRNLGSTLSYVSSSEYTFVTHRPRGSSFTFTIHADSHLDENTIPELFRQSLSNALLDEPDFHIDLGDTPMADKCADFIQGEASVCGREAGSLHETDMLWVRQRPYLGSLCHSAPLLFVQGNHDGEAGQFNDGTNDTLAVWANLIRKGYIPNPDPFVDTFYKGNTTEKPFVGSRQAHFAWEWGDALFVVLDAWWFSEKGSKTDGNDKPWAQSLGEDQYNWLHTTLMESDVAFKFVFVHNLVGGRCDECGDCGDSRGGIEYSHLFEWGGFSVDCTYNFPNRRPGWAMPIHQLFAQANVSAIFHGHDHVYVKQEIDGVVYQVLPQPGASNGKTSLAAEYNYHGDVRASSGHLRVNVSPDSATVEYIRAVLPEDETTSFTNGMIAHSYTITPRSATVPTQAQLESRCATQRALNSKCTNETSTTATVTATPTPTSTPTTTATSATPSPTPMGTGPTPSPTRAPNFMIFMPDDLHFIFPERPPDVHPNGLGTPTVNLDILRDEGVVFNRAYTASPKCAPSRWSLLTGRYCSTGAYARSRTLQKDNDAVRTDVDGSLTLIDSNMYGNDYQNNLAYTLQANGYVTCYAGKYHVSTLKTWDYPETEEIVKDAGYTYAPGVYITNFSSDQNETFSHNMEWVAAGVVSCIESAVAQNKPFFINLQPTIPNGDLMHHAMFDFSLRDTPYGMLSADPDIDMPSRESIWQRAQALVNSSAVQQSDLDQSAGIIWLDEAFGAITRHLNSTIVDGQPLLDNTFIALTMDHGMGAKDLLYEQGTRVVLHARYPPLIPKGVKSNTLVANIDLAATILDIANVSANYNLSGTSWAPVFRNEIDEPRIVFSENYLHRVVIAQNFKMISSSGCWFTCQCTCEPADCTKGTCLDYPYFFNATQMYDLTSDPTEQMNILDDSSFASIRSQLENLINCHDTETHPADPVPGVCATVDTSLLLETFSPGFSASPSPSPSSVYQYSYTAYTDFTSQGSALAIAPDGTSKLTQTASQTFDDLISACKDICTASGMCGGFVVNIKTLSTCQFVDDATDRVASSGRTTYVRIKLEPGVSASNSGTPSASVSPSASPSPVLTYDYQLHNSTAIVGSSIKIGDNDTNTISQAMESEASLVARCKARCLEFYACAGFVVNHNQNGVSCIFMRSVESMEQADNKDAYLKITITPSTSVSPLPVPSASVSPTPSVSPIASISPSPTASPSGIVLPDCTKTSILVSALAAVGLSANLEDVCML